MPTATLPPAATPTLFAPPVNLTAVRTSSASGAPVTYNPARNVLSGLVPVLAMALGDAGQRLFVVAGAQESPGNLQLYRLDSETGEFTSGSILAGFERIDAMLALPARGEEAGVLLSGCAASCGLWRVRLLGGEVVQLVDAAEPLQALHYMRDALGVPLGISVLEPAGDAGMEALLIQHVFAEAPHPAAFESGAMAAVPSDAGEPTDFQVIVVGDMRRAFVAFESGEVRQADLTELNERVVFKRQYAFDADQITSAQFVEGPLRVFPSVDDRIILRFDRLEDPCGTYQRAMGEEVLIVAAAEEVAITRIALSRTSSGTFDHHSGVFQTLAVPDQEFAESYSGRVNLDGSVTGLYRFERNECAVTYAITGQLDPPPPVVAPPVVAWVAEPEALPLLSLRAAGAETFAPLVVFPEVTPALYVRSAVSASGEITFAFNHESGVQVMRVRVGP